jgi:hypothetical protein
VAEVNAFGQAVGDVVPGWEERKRPEPVTLAGRYATLVPLSSAQYADLYAATCGPEDDALWGMWESRLPHRDFQVVVGRVLCRGVSGAGDDERQCGDVAGMGERRRGEDENDEDGDEMLHGGTSCNGTCNGMRARRAEPPPLHLRSARPSGQPRP